MKTMQTNFKAILLLVLTGFALSSCSSDDDSVKNKAPNSFELVKVTDGTDLQPQLSWKTATDPEGDDVTYQVYLDTQNPPQITIANNLEVSTFNVTDALEFGTTYYWMVIAKDANGNTTESVIASFTTRDMTTGEALIGKWFFESIEGRPALTECQKNSYYLFTTDSVLNITFYDDDNFGNCELQGNDMANYEVIGENQLKITGTSNVKTWEIKTLIKTTLVLDQGLSQVITFKKG